MDPPFKRETIICNFVASLLAKGLRARDLSYVVLPLVVIIMNNMLQLLHRSLSWVLSTC